MTKTRFLVEATDGWIIGSHLLFEMQNGKRVYKQPANEDEASQNPALLEKADYVIEWEKIKETRLKKSKLLQPIIKDFVKFLK